MASGDRCVNFVSRVGYSRRHTQVPVTTPSALGLCHFIAGRYPEAARLQREAVTARPHFVSAWRTLASASALSGDREAAAQALAEASKLQPSLSAEWIEKHHPIVHESHRAIYLEGLRQAGLA